MKRFKYILTLVLIGLTCMSVAGQVSFKTVPPRGAVVGRNFQISYKLENGEGTNLKVPQIDGCQLLYGPSTSTSMSVQYVNGQQHSTSSVTYTYTYRADKEGTYTIPSATVSVNGRQYTTQPVSFQILPADRQSPNGGSQASIYDRDTRTTDKKITANDMFVRVILNKSSVYEQEAVECTIKLYTKYDDITSFLTATPPSYDGFLIHEIDVSGMSSQIENYDGQNYLTVVLKKCILYPQKNGDLTINTGSYDLKVVQYEIVNDGIFAYRRPVEKSVKLQPSTKKLTVKALPEGAPDSFNGAVGTFTASSSVSTTSLRTNEAATLKLTVKGTGNIEYLKAPEVHFPVEFEMYEPHIETDVRVAGSNITGSSSIEYTFVPQSVGTFDIPPVQFSYFNPQTATYHTIDLDSYTFDVARGKTVSVTDDRQDVNVKNLDIRHIVTGDKNLSQTHSVIVETLWYKLVYVILIAVFAGYIVIQIKNNKKRADVTGMKTARAGKLARRKLAAAAKAMNQNEPSLFYDAVLSALRGYLSDKYALPVSELTRENISSALRSRGADESLVEQVHNLIDECEMANYSPEDSRRPLKAIYDDASNIMSALQSIKTSGHSNGAKTLTVLLLLTLSSIAGRASNLVEKGDSAYTAGDYPAAISMYNQAIEKEGTSSPLYYNLGNAYYRDGQLANSIIAYERALKLDPTNDDAKYNLEFVNQKTIDRLTHEPSYFDSIRTSLLSLFTSNQWAIVALILFVAVLTGVIVYIFSKDVKLRKIGFFGGIIAMALFGASLYLSIYGAGVMTGNDYAIVTVQSAHLSTSPTRPVLPEQQAFLLHEGTKVKIIEKVSTDADGQNQVWYEVDVDGQNRAWINGQDIEII